jgi:sugar/nucleoside kinase (ribokinase family)
MAPETMGMPLEQIRAECGCTMMAKTTFAFDEVLWDVCLDGEKFGGAPANCASTCAALGQHNGTVYRASAVGKDDLGERLQQILNHCRFQFISRTRGANGAILLARSGERAESNVRQVVVVDIVGAGDAFTTALPLGLLFVQPYQSNNRWATKMAAFVYMQAGGTPRFPSHYELMP